MDKYIFYITEIHLEQVVWSCKIDGLTMFKFNKAAVPDIFNLLTICDQVFIPALSHQVNIQRYSEKLYEDAETVEFWANGRLSGLVAFYCNDHERKVAYVTSK